MSEIIAKCLGCKKDIRLDESMHCEKCEGFYHTQCVNYDVNGIDAKITCSVCGTSLGCATTYETDEEIERLT